LTGCSPSGILTSRIGFSERDAREPRAEALSARDHLREGEEDLRTLIHSYATVLRAICAAVFEHLQTMKSGGFRGAGRYPKLSKCEAGAPRQSFL
jgi:hypothetical protein